MYRQCAKIIIAGSLGLTPFGCDKRERNQEFVMLCTAACRAEICFADISEDFPVQACIDNCVENRQPEAETVSEACGAMNTQLMQCLVGRDCQDELVDWYDNRKMDGEYVCNAETAAFRDACPGVWFAPE